MNLELNYFFPNIEFIIALPIFLSSPERVVGIPVALEMLLFALETPTARFHEKLRPGIFILFDLNFV